LSETVQAVRERLEHISSAQSKQTSRHDYQQ
jgi:hypothetical protein